MPNDQDFIDYIVDQIDATCNVRYRHMFGGTTLYSNDKVVALICENQLFVKPTAAGREFIGTVVEAPPYEGAKPSYLIEDQLDDSDWMTQLIQLTEAALPAPKPRKKKGSTRK